nr:MAG TPA: hypothetical protein [Caudoviricetes sp.]
MIWAKERGVCNESLAKETYDPGSRWRLGKSGMGNAHAIQQK